MPDPANTPKPQSFYPEIPGLPPTVPQLPSLPKPADIARAAMLDFPIADLLNYNYPKTIKAAANQVLTGLPKVELDATSHQVGLTKGGTIGGFYNPADNTKAAFGGGSKKPLRWST